MTRQKGNRTFRCNVISEILSSEISANENKKRLIFWLQSAFNRRDIMSNTRAPDLVVYGTRGLTVSLVCKYLNQQYGVDGSVASNF